MRLKGTRDAYGEALLRLGEINERVVVLDADLSTSTKTSKFGSKFKDRFFNMGVSEADMLGTAAGLAASGKIPFVSSFAIFAAGKAWEQIRQSIAYTGLNVKIVATHGGITVGEDGASHQAIEDIALMRILPKMVVIVPADPVETEKVIFEIARYEGPVYVRLGRINVPFIFDEGYEFEIGRGRVISEGKDVTIIAAGFMVYQSLEAAKILKEEGITARVINMSTIKPIDEELIIQSAKETGAIVTCEEHSIIGGLGSAVAEVIVESCNVPMKRVGIMDRFGTSGSAEELMEYFGLTPRYIVRAVKEVLKRKNDRNVSCI